MRDVFCSAILTRGDTTSPVGSFGANAFGLHDMHGNVWERVEDCWNGDYGNGPNTESARISGDCSLRVYRGGSWSGTPGIMRAAFRFRYSSGSRFDFVGFRLARTH